MTREDSEIEIDSEKGLTGDVLTYNLAHFENQVWAVCECVCCKCMYVGCMCVCWLYVCVCWLYVGVLQLVDYLQCLGGSTTPAHSTQTPCKLKMVRQHTLEGTAMSGGTHQASAVPPPPG